MKAKAGNYRPDNTWSPDWPAVWIENRILYASIAFTWHLDYMRSRLEQRSFDWDTAVVGGPAVKLVPTAFDGMEHVSLGDDTPSVLQRVNPMATKTSTGCIRSCEFCCVPHTEGKIRELPDWPDRPLLIDNNILATSQKHFDRVIDRLKEWPWTDFNQGMDARLLNEYHAQRLMELKRPMIRLALDSLDYVNDWISALEILLAAGLPKTRIRSYALIGFDSDPDEAWKRCEYIESFGIKALPMWFHELDATKRNDVTEKQVAMGWSDFKRNRIMQWYYQHKDIRLRGRKGPDLFSHSSSTSSDDTA